MASGRKQNPVNNLIMMKPGLRAQIPDSPSLSGTPRGPAYYLNAGYENTENVSRSHDYEDLEHYHQIPVYPRKTNNSIYQQTTPEMKIERYRQFTECSDDTASSSSVIHSTSSSKCSHWFNKVILVLILLASVTAMILVILMIHGVLGPKCGCATNSKTIRQLTQINRPFVSTSSLFEIINRLERNISSMTVLVGKHQKEILDLKTKLTGLNENTQEDSPTSIFKQNITTEMRALREKQVQLDSSLTNLKESDKTKTTDIQQMNTRVIGLAVAVKFLSKNDSLIKSKVHSLSQAEVSFRSSLEALKQKNAELETSIQRAKNVEALVNSSMNQLQSVDGQLKTNVTQMNSLFITKIKDITGKINVLQNSSGSSGSPGAQGPPGSPGAGNLSQCEHKQKKIEGTSDSAGKYSVLFIEPKDKIVMGATCSTLRGDETNLSSSTNSQGEKVYSCQCKGQSNVHNDSGKMKCFIDVWVCPRIS